MDTFMLTTSEIALLQKAVMEYRAETRSMLNNLIARTDPNKLTQATSLIADYETIIANCEIVFDKITRNVR